MINNDQGRNSTKYSGVYYLAFIILLVTASYAVTMQSPFQWDDIVLVRDNAIIKNIKYFIYPESAGELLNYEIFISRYVTYATYGLNYFLHGTEIRGYHVFNILLHIANTLAVYILLGKLMRIKTIAEMTSEKQQFFIPLFCTLLFALHPVQTEAVNYIGQRGVPLSTFFYLLSLILFIQYKQVNEFSNKPFANGLYFYIICLVSAVLAFKSKQNTATLPVMILFMSTLLYKQRFSRTLLENIPLFLLVLLIPLGMQKSGIPMMTVLFGQEIDPATVTVNSTFLHDYIDPNSSRSEYIITQIRVLVTYVRLLIFPVHQNFDYDYTLHTRLLTPEIILSLIFLLFLVFLSFWAYRRFITESKSGFLLISIGIFWFLISLSIEFFVRIPMIITEYRLYLPSIGFFIALSGTLTLLLEIINTERISKFFTIFFVIAAACLSFATYQRNTVWESNISLWTDTVNKSPYKARTRYNLAKYLKEAGDTDRAITHYMKTIELQHDYPEAHTNLGNVFREKNMYEKAVLHYEIALSLSPNDKVTLNNLGITFARKGLYGKAIDSYKAALNIDPYFVFALNNLGNTYRAMKQFNEALEFYKKALEIEPGNQTILNNYRTTNLLLQNIPST